MALRLLLLRTSCLALAWLAADAHAQTPPATASETDVATLSAASSDAETAASQLGDAAAECTTQELRLDGASAEYNAADIHFSEQWRPLLLHARDCLGRPEHARSCLEVQGQYDERTFERAVTRALGSERAAQLHRARARAEAVLSELHALGVSAERLRHRPPPAAPTYRGASVTLVAGCMPEPAQAELPAWASSPEALASELKQRGLLSNPEPAPQPSPLSPPSPAPQPSAAPQSPPPRAFWIEAGAEIGGMLGDPEPFVLGGPRVGFGGVGSWLYLHGSVALSLGGLPEQRTGFEYMVAGGVRALPWLEVGALFGHRIASHVPLEPWLSQSWRVGVESAQRLVSSERWSLWLTEAVAPLGARIDRAVVVNGQVFDIDDQRNYALRMDIGLSVRAQIF